MIIQLLAIALSLNSLNTTFNANAASVTQEEPTLQQELAAMNGALKGTQEFIESARNRDFRQIVQQQFDNAIKALIADLRARDNHVMADELVGRWSEAKSVMFLNMKDLGDHSPLFPWLENFFQKLANQYGTIVFTFPLVSDIRTLNFAVPVVFAPRGTWQMADVDNRIEFRKHFIPFANIITYYAANYGCQYLLEQNGLGQLKKICGKAADKLKFVMGRYLAAPISDFIYKAANNPNRNHIETLEFTDKELVYTTADQLLEAVKSEESIEE